MMCRPHAAAPAPRARAPPCLAVLPCPPREPASRHMARRARECCRKSMPAACWGAPWHSYAWRTPHPHLRASLVLACSPVVAGAQPPRRPPNTARVGRPRAPHPPHKPRTLCPPCARRLPGVRGPRPLRPRPVADTRDPAPAAPALASLEPSHGHGAPHGAMARRAAHEPRVRASLFLAPGPGRPAPSPKQAPCRLPPCPPVGLAGPRSDTVSARA